jgi:membrane protein involved in colicin uptake
MRRSAGKSWRAKASAIALLVPTLTLGACASQNDVMAEKVAAAEAAAAKAVAAQQAAEKAAAVLTANAPAPRAEPTVMADTPSAFAEEDHDDGNPGNNSNADNALSMGDDGQTSSSDGVPVIGHGA